MDRKEEREEGMKKMVADLSGEEERLLLVAEKLPFIVPRNFLGKKKTSSACECDLF